MPGLTDEGQDDSEQRGCWEGDGHVHLQHLQKIHWGGQRHHRMTNWKWKRSWGANVNVRRNWPMKTKIWWCEYLSSMDTDSVCRSEQKKPSVTVWEQLSAARVKLSSSNWSDGASLFNLIYYGAVICCSDRHMRTSQSVGSTWNTCAGEAQVLTNMTMMTKAARYEVLAIHMLTKR